MAHAAKLLAYHGYNTNHYALKLLIEQNVSIRNIAIGYAMGNHQLLAEDLLFHSIFGKKAAVTDLVMGYALVGNKDAAEKMVKIGIAGQKGKC